MLMATTKHHHGLAPGEKPHESPWVVWLPLVLLAIPSFAIGFMTIDPLLFGSYFKDSIHVSGNHGAMAELAEEYGGAIAKVGHALLEPPIWFALAGVLVAWLFYMKRPDIPVMLRNRCPKIYEILDRKYGFDEFNDWFFAGGARGVSGFLWKFGDVKLIDGLMVNGSAKLVGMFAGLLRRFQTGYIYHYAFSMIIGVFVLLTVRNWFE